MGTHNKQNFYCSHETVAAAEKGGLWCGNNGIRFLNKHFNGKQIDATQTSDTYRYVSFSSEWIKINQLAIWLNCLDQCCKRKSLLYAIQWTNERAKEKNGEWNEGASEQNIEFYDTHTYSIYPNIDLRFWIFKIADTWAWRNVGASMEHRFDCEWVRVSLIVVRCHYYSSQIHRTFWKYRNPYTQPWHTYAYPKCGWMVRCGFFVNSTPNCYSKDRNVSIYAFKYPFKWNSIIFCFELHHS